MVRFEITTIDKDFGDKSKNNDEEKILKKIMMKKIMIKKIY